jgi:hypothetical protein
MDQPNLDDLVFAIVQLFKNLNEPITDEGVRAELPSVDIKGNQSIASEVAGSRSYCWDAFHYFPNLMNKA